MSIKYIMKINVSYLKDRTRFKKLKRTAIRFIAYRIAFLCRGVQKGKRFLGPPLVICFRISNIHVMYSLTTVTAAVMNSCSAFHTGWSTFSDVF